MRPHQSCIIQTQTHDSPPTAWQLYRWAKLQDKAKPLWMHKTKSTPAGTERRSITHAPSSQQVVSAYLLRQLSHLEIPRAQTVISVDSPVGYVVTKAECICNMNDAPRQNIWFTSAAQSSGPSVVPDCSSLCSLEPSWGENIFSFTSIVLNFRNATTKTKNTHTC